MYISNISKIVSFRLDHAKKSKIRGQTVRSRQGGSLRADSSRYIRCLQIKLLIFWRFSKIVSFRLNHTMKSKISASSRYIRCLQIELLIFLFFIIIIINYFFLAF